MQVSIQRSYVVIAPFNFAHLTIILHLLWTFPIETTSKEGQEAKFTLNVT
jgi:hypothetical protein